MNIKLLPFFLLFLTTVTYSQNKIFWNKIDVVKRTSDNNEESFYHLNIEGFKKHLKETLNKNKRKSNIIISFPNVKGDILYYKINEYNIMHPKLAAKYPKIKSYKGINIKNPLDKVYFSISPKGLQSMTLLDGAKDIFITPVKKKKSVYRVYHRKGNKESFECKTVDKLNKKIEKNETHGRNANDGILRTYRAAVSVTGEYTDYHGGTRALAMAAINATMTRVNAVFEKDFNVRMQLIANNDRLIYLDRNTDPYAWDYNSDLQDTLTAEIGENNYDIGHLLTAGGNNGNAGCIGCVCEDGRKGSGYSSHNNPEGDNFDIDYVSHEIGHQFGANHTWSHRGSEGRGVHMEPGTGSTIMGYAGIGGNANVQLHSDPYFHAASIRQVTNVVKGTMCQVDVNTGNNIPVVNAGGNYTIPKGTPFVLTGEANDADVGDILTYCWEQIDDNRGGSTYPSPTRTRGVAFRSYEPTIENKRYFPNLSTIKEGKISWKWEALANVSRSYNFRLTVRDNRGTNNSDDAEIRVNDAAGPFVVNYPNSENITWNVGSFEIIEWDVAGTDGNGINEANVDILLSTDGGNTYPIELATGVANDGRARIIVPDVIGNNNRVMIKAANNVFFDISNKDFSIEPAVICVASKPTNFNVSNIQGTSAIINWDEIGGAIFRVRYRSVATGDSFIKTITSNTTSLTDLVPNTEYEVRVKSRCTGAVGNVDSDFTDVIRFRTTHNYCALESESEREGFISKLELGTISNSSGSSIYTNYNHISTNLRKGVEQELKITPNKRSFFARYRYIVWIDYNRDGDFNDPNERVIRTDRIRDNSITEKFTIPNTVADGYAKMRVAMVEGNTGPCGTFFAGEVEDYAINITSVVDNEIPVITLLGNVLVEVEAGSIYNDSGATAIDNIDGNLTGAIITVNNVDTSVLGDYQVRYNVVDSSGNNAIEVIRIVRVIDTQIPVITLNNNVLVEVEAGSIYNDLGATAIDNIDGNLTGAIITVNNVDTSVLGDYQVTYNVVDSSGNNAIEVIRTVRVIDTQIPVITLNNDVLVEVEAGSIYNDSGATATDNIDGNLTGAIVTVNNVDTSVLGDYQVRYNVVDSSGNNAIEVIRTVRVIDTQIPVITLNNNVLVEVEAGSIYNDSGATAIDNIDGNLTGAIVTVNNVDTSVLGDYQVRYNVVDSSGNNAIEVIRTVRVIDTQIPVITLNNNVLVEVEAGSIYNDSGATAIDNIDGNLTGAIITVNNVDTSVLGDYQVRYNVVDNSGNNAIEVIRTVRVIDTQIPVITLTGNEIEEIEFGGSFNDSGATAIDNLDGDITKQIIISGNVDTKVLGVYIIKYNVTDSSGNKAIEVRREVRVKSKKVIVYPNPVEVNFIKIVFPEKESSYFISDFSGRKLLEGKVKDGGEINIEVLSSGVYHISLVLNNKVKTVKFLKK
ncbi:DUF5011 domain-containing protein [Tenacibaculum sp. Cn5-1]|uniref:immunoglobulin-like domain-containing protein n=3 Tax=Tenacibaculum TaxID=104267 RepID=UPI001F387D7D|nr:immunoglobulin-like domain-containing protein [Tenacibaculum sp. Cn5-1]MCF2873914.1 DUF5011 domain-containing protein [Tenacibaculum sp. Cn5-1]